MKNEGMMKKRLSVQLWVAVFLSFAGLVLLFCGFFVPPLGVIDNSVLVAYGETSTFAGALFGVDYNYRFKRYLNDKLKEDKDGE